MTAPVDVEFNTKDVTVYLAAAGAGKTHAMMAEMSEELKVCRPDELAFVTFTRKGVRNGIDRAIKVNPQLGPEDLVYFQTLHSLCFHEAGLRHKNIIEHRDIVRFNNLLGFSLSLAVTFDHQSDDDKLMQRYDAIRSGGGSGVFVESLCDEERYDRLVSAYETFKKDNDLVDFYDCLIRYRDLNKPLNVKVFMIDEAQDLTKLHWEVVQIASRNAERIRISGDDYQSLFSYSGASPETLIHLAEKYNTVKLEQSYRLPMAVYKFAKGITKMIQNKVDKDYYPVSDEAGFVKDISDRNTLARIVRSDLENEGYKPGRWYFLFRANHFIADVADMLEQFSVPYHTSRGFCINDRDLARIQRYYAYRKTGYGTVDARQRFAHEFNIKDFSEDFTESDIVPTDRRFVYLDYVKKWGIDELVRISKSEPHILLATTYKVKGGECDYCAVFLDTTKLVAQNTMFDLDSELRVLYVACTRPRKGLYLVSSSGTYGHDNVIGIVKDLVEEAQ